MNAVRFYLRIYNFGKALWDEKNYWHAAFIYIYVILVLPVETYFNYILYHYCPSLHEGKKNFRIRENSWRILHVSSSYHLILGESLTAIKENFERYVFFTYFIICFKIMLFMLICKRFSLSSWSILIFFKKSFSVNL